MQQNQLLDLDAAPVLREGKPAVEGSLTPEQAAAYQRGDITPNNAPPPEPPAQQHQTPATPVSTAPAVPTNQPAGAPPVYPTDSERVQTRINKLYAQRRNAEELAEQQARRIEDLERRLNGFAVAQPSQVPGHQYEVYNPGAVNAGSQSEQALTPDLIARVIDQRMQVYEQRQANIDAVRNAQNASRAEAEGDFPDVFQSPNVRAVFDQILRSDPSLAQDPQGPYKAAAMARGFQDPLSAAGQSASPDARKQAIAGVGPSVAEGSQNSGDLRTQYHQALALARQTGRDSDYVRAYQLQHQLTQAQGG